MKLFILEDAQPRIDWFQRKFCFADIDIARSMNEVVRNFHGPYDVLFLDHDLGNRKYVGYHDGNTGSAFCHWLNNTDFDKSTPIIIHSHNPGGATNMLHTLNDFGFADVKQLPFVEIVIEWEEGNLSICGRKKCLNESQLTLPL